MGLAIVDKRRQKANSSEVMNIIGDVRGKKVILFDDMVDTAGSLCGAAQALVELGGAPFKAFAAQRDRWAMETDYVYPGPIQYFGPTEVCDQATKTLQLEQAK